MDKDTTVIEMLLGSKEMSNKVRGLLSFAHSKINYKEKNTQISLPFSNDVMSRIKLLTSRK